MTHPIHNADIDYTQGLSSKQVQERISQGFINVQSESITKSYQEIFQDNLFTLFNLINAILAGLIIFIGSFRNLLFLGVVISNVCIGIFQEIRAKRILDKLSLITQSKIKVIRDGKEQEIHMQELVMDDVMQVSTGDQICADAIVLDGKLEVNESLLTGESDIIIKHTQDSLYSGSFITSGNAKCKVIHVGKDNYAETIMCDAKRLSKHKSQLRDSINYIIKMIGIIIIPIGILLFSKQLFITGATFPEAIVSTVAALLGMVPEGLVLLTSMALAVGSINLAKHKTLVQELYCIETLARVDMLCIDKTGTITEGKMQVENVLPINTDKETLQQILAELTTAIQDDNSTSLAIQQYVKDRKAIKKPLITLPFSSSRKYSAASFAEDGTYGMGAYNFLCDYLQEDVLKQIELQSSLGNRVLVVVHTDACIEQDTISKQNRVLGLILLSDPIRKEAAQTLDYFLSQGVDIKVISGDDPRTVHAIARRANLKNYDQFVDMSTIQDLDIPKVMKQYTVFGRVSPQQKKLMIHALKEQGHITAMIGDGVNDVMALKEADCSISLAQGSEAAKNISNLVLLDNNFANMPRIVDEGRRVINNIQRASSMFLVKTTFSTILSILTLFFIRRYPFEPIQLTLISTLTIGIPSFFLALEANQTRVEGNFLLNVLGRALPGALCVVLSILYVNILSLFFMTSKEVMSTMCVLLTGASSIVVLYRVSTPFTKKRCFLFTSMTSLFILAIVFFPNVFSLVKLPLFHFILTIGGMLAIPFVMDLMYRIASRFKLKERILKVGK